MVKEVMEMAAVMFSFHLFPGKKVFGVPLMVNVQRHGHSLPPLVLQAMEHLKKEGLGDTLAQFSTVA